MSAGRIKRLFKEITPDYNPNLDPWGHAMGAYFAVAEVLHFEHDYTVPTFRPGAARGPETDNFEYQAIQELGVTDTELIELARFLDRLTARIDRAGRSY